MVLDVNHTIPTISTNQSSDEESDYDVISVGTSEVGSYNKALALQEENPQPSFGNIAVQNSTDVHFGNKTYYQGPVTIKQILYTNPNGEQSQGETPCIKDSDGTVNPGYIVTDSGADLDLPNGTSKVQNGKELEIEKNWLSRLSFPQILVGTLLVSGSLIAIIIITSVFLTQDSKEIFDSSEEETAVPNKGTVDPSVTLTISDKLRILTRKEWLGRPPVKPANLLKTPVSLVVITHSATENCTQISDCKDRMRDMQNFHMDTNGWWDIGYNFAVGGDGYAYEGRGWTFEGAHTFGFNARSIGICFIGTFNDIKPPDWQVKAALDLMEIGAELNYLTKDYTVIGHRQVQRTLSPGDELYKIVKNWTHWHDLPKNSSKH